MERREREMGETGSGAVTGPWFREMNIGARVCVRPVRVAESRRCVCGLLLDAHDASAVPVIGSTSAPFRPPNSRPTRALWSIKANTCRILTNAFGQLHFQGTTTLKAPFARLEFSTEPDKVVQLLTCQWGMQRPKLLISVMGSALEAPLSPQLFRCLTSGLFKAAQATPTWILASGLCRGVSELLGDVMSEPSRPEDLRCIGIAPWGMVKHRWDMEYSGDGDPPPVIYRPKIQGLAGKSFTLHPNYDAFIFPDDGTYGVWGADTYVRESLEDSVGNWKLEGRPEGSKYDLETPVVGLLIGGGIKAFSRLKRFVRRKFTVVVLGGSGGLAELIHRAYNGDTAKTEKNKYGLDKIEEELIALVDNNKEIFLIHDENDFFPVKRVNMGLDRTIFKAGIAEPPRHKSFSNKQWERLKDFRTLKLCMEWNRVDIAQEEIFKAGTYYPDSFLNRFAWDALRMDRCNFLQLLLANSLSLQHFLTPTRLEELYNLPPESMAGSFFKRNMTDMLRVDFTERVKIRLRHVGELVELLIGSAYTSSYTSDAFTTRQAAWEAAAKKHRADMDSADPFFPHPCNDLLVWAVLRNRVDLAMLFATRGPDSLAKALVATKLFSALATEASLDINQHELTEELSENAKMFERHAMKLVGMMYAKSPELTGRLMTSSLGEWGSQTNLSLAVIARVKKLVAHPACQGLLDDLWKGGLNERRSLNAKVVACIFLPFLIPFLKYKTVQEIKLQAQTAAEMGETEALELWIEGPNDASRRDDSYGGQGSRRTLRPLRPRFSPSTATAPHNSTGNTPQFKNVPRPRKPPHETSPDDITNGQDGTRTTAGADVEKAKRPVGQKNWLRRTLSGIFSRQERPEEVLYAERDDQPLPANLRVRSDTNPLTPPEHQEKIRLVNRFKEFYTAPITRYWLSFLSYIVFLGALSWMMLTPTWEYLGMVELFVASYVGATAVDFVVLKTVMLPRSFFSKLRMFSSWEMYRLLCSCWYLLALVFRCGLEMSGSAAEFQRNWGRVGLATNMVMWFINLFSFLYVFRRLGVSTSIMFKMLLKMVPLLSILLVGLTAFGLARQAIRVPRRPEMDGTAVRDIFFHPYFMLYGEVFADEIDRCGDETAEGDPFACAEGHWVVPIMLSIFLIITIAILTLLIADISNVYTQMEGTSHETWSFGRYGVVMEWEARTTLPPPLSVLQSLGRLGVFVVRGALSEQGSPDLHVDLMLKTRPGPEEAEALTNLEERAGATFQPRIRLGPLTNPPTATDHVTAQSLLPF